MEEYKVSIHKFEGPLDLLLHLIKNSKIDIYDIPISEITEQYIKYLNLMKKLDLELTTEFIQMAATLLYIKSKMLLPLESNIGDDLEEEDPRKELVEKLFEYQKFKHVIENFREKEEQQSINYIRNKSQLIMDFQKDQNWVEISIFDLLTAFNNIVSEIDEKDFFMVYPEKVTVEMKVEEIVKMLHNKNYIYFFELFGGEINRYEVIVAFLAVLQLVKDNKIIIQQHQLFGDIRIILRNGKDKN